MSKRQLAVLGGLLVLIVPVSIMVTIVRHGDLGAVIIGCAVFVVSILTLYYVTPTAAAISVDPQTELDPTDLIFFLYEDVPGDYLLQFSVAVANVGGRKAVLSKLEMHGFLDKNGVAVVIPELPLPIRAVQAVPRGQYLSGGGFDFHMENVYPPYVLEPDDVIALRFRARRGINWSEKWNLERVQSFATALQRSITQATVTATFRKGREVETTRFEVPMVVEQQAKYVEALGVLTSGFRVMPDVSVPAVDFE